MLPPISTSRFAHLCLPRRSLGVGGSLASPRLHSRSCPCRFTLITRTSQCLRQLPSCVAVYPRDSQSRRVLRRCSRQLHCISLAPARLDRYPRGVTGHVAHPVSSIVSRSLPLGSTATLAALPAMSLIPVAPFCSCSVCRCRQRLALQGLFGLFWIPAVVALQKILGLELSGFVFS